MDKTMKSEVNEYIRKHYTATDVERDLALQDSLVHIERGQRLLSNVWYVAQEVASLAKLRHKKPCVECEALTKKELAESKKKTEALLRFT